MDASCGAVASRAASRGLVVRELGALVLFITAVGARLLKDPRLEMLTGLI